MTKVAVHTKAIPRTAKEDLEMADAPELKHSATTKVGGDMEIELGATLSTENGQGLNEEQEFDESREDKDEEDTSFASTTLSVTDDSFGINSGATGNDLSEEPIASTSSIPYTKNVRMPSGPICTYGPRLAYTYFKSPAPRADALNVAYEAAFPSPSPSANGSVHSGLNSERKRGSAHAPEPRNGLGEVHWFSVDDQLVYLSFFQDSGPLNAACLYRFCLHVHTLLEDANLRNKRIILFSSDEPDKKANAALLVALYAMIVMRWNAADVLHPIAILELQPFRDAGYARADFHLSVQSCIYGIQRAISLHLLDLSTFDLASYECYEKVENGDWNWITPGFVAFASPVEVGYTAKASHQLTKNGNEDVAVSVTGDGKGKLGHARTLDILESARPRLSKAFKNVLSEFEKSGVKVVVRLNKKLYDKRWFEERGIEHIEMYFDDGTNPTMEMTRHFIELSNQVISSGGVVAVHCKAGLGRTGTLIGAYLIYKHGFTASEAIGFMRLMRPGSCVGPQQHFLYENQATWIKWAAVDAVRAEYDARDKQAIIASTNSTNHTELCQTRPITPPSDNFDPVTVPLRSQMVTPPPGPIACPTTPGQSPPLHGSPVQYILTSPKKVKNGAAPAAPQTPGHHVAVPGQPRKTPGKSKNTVASPEVKDDSFAEDNNNMTLEWNVAGELAKEPPETQDTNTEMMLGSKMDVTDEMATLMREQEEIEEGGVSMPLPGSTPAKGPPAPYSTTPATKSITISTTYSTSAVKPTASSPSRTTSRPTRIARAAPRTRQRPLSAITDNRIVDRLGLTAGVASPNSNGVTFNNQLLSATRGDERNSTNSRVIGHGGRGHRGSAAASLKDREDIVQRSQKVKDLGRLFEDPLSLQSLNSDESRSGGRYALRGGPSGAGNSKESATTVSIGSSPSKLPTRIPAKRRGTASVLEEQQPIDTMSSRSTTSTSTSSFSAEKVDLVQVNHITASHAGAVGKTSSVLKLNAGAGIGLRSARRRRSSLGSTDYVPSSTAV